MLLKIHEVEGQVLSAVNVLVIEVRIGNVAQGLIACRSWVRRSVYGGAAEAYNMVDLSILSNTDTLSLHYLGYCVVPLCARHPP